MLGAGRSLWLAPRIGPLLALLSELPLMLAASWLAARLLTRRFGIATAGAALAMGLAAFALLLLAEVALAGALAGQTPAGWVQSLAAPLGALGLAGQAAFGMMPWWAVRNGRAAR